MSSQAPPRLEAPRGWQAELDLRLRRREQTSVLLCNRHRGPLQVQKALYPEGPHTCHIAVLHPPGGIAAGDSLDIRVQLDAGAEGLLTTPGATKWYRSEGACASQALRLHVARDATLEWLPRENILFDGCRASMSLEVELAQDARFLGWDITSFGRRAAGERWQKGCLKLRTRVRRGARLIWSEDGDLDANDGFLSSPVGLANATVCGAFLAVGPTVGVELVDACRAVMPLDPRARIGITRVPQVLIARYLGHSTEDAFRWFTALWTIVRPAVANKIAHAPRVWAC